MTIVQSRWFKVSQSSTASFLGGFVLSYYCAMAATSRQHASCAGTELVGIFMQYMNKIQYARILSGA